MRAAVRRTSVPNVAAGSYAIAAIRRSAARRRDLDIDRVRARVRVEAPATSTSHDRKVEERELDVAHLLFKREETKPTGVCSYICVRRRSRDVRLFVGVFYSSLYNVAYIRMKNETQRERERISLSDVRRSRLVLKAHVQRSADGRDLSCFLPAVARLIIRLHWRRIISRIIVIVIVDVVRLFAGVLEPLEPFADLKQGFALARYGIVDVLSPLEKGIFFDDVQIVRVDEQTQ